VGRTGKITPIAILEPCELAGATISRATLNNVGDIEKKGVKIGASVFIRRSNDVIPEVLGLAQDFENSKKIEPPAVCPACGNTLVTIGAHLYCDNFYHCPPQIVGKLEHFCNKDAFDVEGLSEKTLQVLYEKLNISEPYQLYNLTAEQISELNLEGFKDKKIENIINSIEKSRHNKTFADFLYAISIRNVGKKIAKDIAKKFTNIEKLITATTEELTQVDEVGEVIAKSITDFFADEKNLQNCNLLLEKLSLAEVRQKTGVFSGQVVVITGTLQNYSRTQAKQLVEQLGGETSESVSKSTTLLIYGESAGSKLDKANKLGIKVIDESEFVNLTENLEN